MHLKNGIRVRRSEWGRTHQYLRTRGADGDESYTCRLKLLRAFVTAYPFRDGGWQTDIRLGGKQPICARLVDRFIDAIHFEFDRDNSPV